MSDPIEHFRLAIAAAGMEAPDSINPDGKIHRFSTNGKRGDDSGWYMLHTNGIAAGAFGCWRQGVTCRWRDGFSNQQSHKRDAYADKLALAEQEKKNQRHGRINAKIFDCAHPLKRQSPVGQYLVHRGLEALKKRPLALRMATLPYFEDGIEHGQFPVMLGAVTAPDGMLLGLHRTYISDIGRKAPVTYPKKLSRTSGLLAGASIKLFEPTIINGKLTLGVAEGIETALACYLASGIPTWSCVSASGIKSFQWPAGLQSIVIFGDNDASGVGQSAARDLAGRAAAAGLECRVLIPETIGTDWLDAYVGCTAL
jgi:putative DNA primase/helicase